MIQKITWMQLLIIGIISGIILISNISCTKVDYIITSRYIYQNNSSYDLTMEVYNREANVFKKYSILKNNSLTIEYLADNMTPPFYYIELINEDGLDYQVKGDSVIIFFENKKSLTYTPCEINEEMCDGVFELQKYNTTPLKRGHILYYHFSNIDFENATPINL